jgi:AcrR family transcriptional regulator
VAKAVKRLRSSAPPRRRPTQERSQRRYEEIVDAAATSFADFGFDATTMEGIAARARTSIGSLYQFFPNKHALFREVAQTCLTKSRALLQAVLVKHGPSNDWRVLLDATIDGFRELQHDTFLQAIYRNLQLYGEWRDADAALHDEQVGLSAAMIAQWAPQLAAEHRRTIAKTLVNAVTALMLQLSRVRDEAHADALVAETKTMLHRYVEPYVAR